MPKLQPKEVAAAKTLIRKQRGDYCHLGQRRKEEGLPGCGGISGRTYRKKTHRDFILNHKDHNPAHNPEEGSNWELACNSCNTLDRPRSKSSVLRTAASPYRTRGNVNRENMHVRSNRHISLRDKGKSTLQRNREREKQNEANRSNEYARVLDNGALLDRKRFKAKQKRFRKWVENRLIDLGSADYEDAIDAGAETVDVDQQSTRRWLKRMTSSAGALTTIPGKNNQGEDITLLVFKREYQHKVVDQSLIPKLPTITPEYIQDESTR